MFTSSCRLDRVSAPAALARTRSLASGHRHDVTQCVILPPRDDGGKWAVYPKTTCTRVGRGLAEVTRPPGVRYWTTLVRVSLLDRIAIDSQVRFGKPCMRGTRISVGDVLGYLAGGMSEDEIRQDFPQMRFVPA